jgi:hypothetical protein
MYYMYRSFFQFVGDLAELKEKDYGTGQQTAIRKELLRPPAPEVSSNYRRTYPPVQATRARGE